LQRILASATDPLGLQASDGGRQMDSRSVLRLDARAPHKLK
jgi:hypothetical protein